MKEFHRWDCHTLRNVLPRMPHVLILPLLLACSAPVFANDTRVVGIGGTIQRMQGKDAAIRMVREDVQIEIGSKSSDTTATFVFQNDSTKPVQTRMGFPESGGGESGGGEFDSFVTTVDGVPTTAKRILTPQRSATSEDFQAFWVKTVHFAPHQTHRIVVRYRAAFSTTTGMLRTAAMYNFTGGNWHGLVSESHLTVHFQSPGTCAAIFSFGDKDVVMAQSAPGTFTHTWRNWSAEGDFVATFAQTMPDWLIARNSRIHAFMVERKNPKIVTFAVAPATLRPDDWMFWSPDAYLDHGVLYANVWTISDQIRAQCIHAAKITEDQALGTPSLAIKQFGPSFGFADFLKVTVEKGTVHVVVDGKEPTLPHPPRIFGSNVNCETIYIPLSDLMAFLGGSVSVDRAQHRFTCTLPDATVTRLIAASPAQTSPSGSNRLTQRNPSDKETP